MPTKVTYREALNQALREEMRRDDQVFLIGEDVAYYQGAFKVSKGFLEEFGSRRVVDTPITELGFTCLAIRAAMAGGSPVVFIEAQLLYAMQGEIGDGDYTIPLGVAEVKRPGTDVTLIAYSKMLLVALEAAEKLAQEGIQAEVVDPRTLRPLDLTTLAASAKKTGKVVIVEEGWPFAGLGAQIAESLYRRVFDYLDGPIVRVTGRDAPMPYARNLEDAAIPDADQVVAAAHQVLYRT